MEFSLKSLTLLAATILVGLSAGFFYAWLVSVIPGTKKVLDITYLETMQSINLEILNPAFYLIFFGSPIIMIISMIQQYQSGITFWILLAAVVVYLVGTFGVTILGNVPLNDALEALKLSELSEVEIIDFRNSYERKWNSWHWVRTICSVISFILMLIGVFIYSKSIFTNV
ncbi:MAG: DUF1772 domain-containing protein [Saprospiraceae bacterium]|nr:DUF1772 domain-containing protein [Saprospiraceae bacterium]